MRDASRDQAAFAHARPATPDYRPAHHEPLPSMTLAIPLKEFDMEMATTRRVLERVPSDKGEWKPHPKSFALGHLTQLVATMPGWLIRMLGDTHIDLAGQSGYSFQSTDSLVAQFDKLVRDARTSIEAARDEQLGEPWSLMRGGTVLFTSPRGTVVRTHVNHMVH